MPFGCYFAFLGLIAGKALSAAPQKGRASLGRMGEVVLNTEGPFSDADNLLHLSFRMRLCPSRTTSGVEKPSFLGRSLPFWGQDPGQAFLFGLMGPQDPGEVVLIIDGDGNKSKGVALPRKKL